MLSKPLFILIFMTLIGYIFITTPCPFEIGEDLCHNPSILTQLISKPFPEEGQVLPAQTETLPSPTPLPTYSPFPIPKATSQTRTHPVIVSQPTPTPDPIITCLIHKDCVGGSIQLRSSLCSNSTCCQIGDKWIFYQSKAKCIEDQNRQTKQVTRPNPIPQKNTSSYTGEPIIDCQVYGTTIKLPSDVCEKEKKHDQENKTYIESTFGKEVALQPCTLYYAALNESLTYEVSKETCDKWQKEQNEENVGTETLRRKQNTMSPTTTTQDYTAFCKNELKAREQNALALFGTSSSTFFGIQQVYHSSCYPRCLSSGTWPSDCGVTLSQPKPSPSYEGTQVYPWVPQY